MPMQVTTTLCVAEDSQDAVKGGPGRSMSVWGDIYIESELTASKTSIRPFTGMHLRRHFDHCC
jgi:hypothetical protein